MLKSKEIADFVPVELGQLRADVPIPGDLHLYFKSNSHVMLWQAAGTVFTPEMLEKYRQRGIAEIWVHRSDWEAFSRYLSPASEQLPPQPVSKPPLEPYSEWEQLKKTSPPPPPTELIYHTKVSSRDLETILLDTGKSEREKRALAAKSSRTLLGELAAPANLEEQDIVRRAVAKVVQELVSPSLIPDGMTGEQSASVQACQQIWKIATKDPALCHGVNVSTTSALFALAFGRIERELLADIALAGLLHDVGMTLLPYQLSQLPRESLGPEELNEYLSHTDESPKLISAFSPGVSERARLLTQYHHERYSLESSSPLADLSELVGMADAIDSICSGHWDGKERTFFEALQRLEELESGEKGRQFNPDIFAAVLRWIRGNIPEDTLAEAAAITSEQVRAVQSSR